jgi:hypothetical protein
MKTLIIGVIVTCFLYLMSSNTNFFVYGQEEKKQQNDLIFQVSGLKTSPTNKDFQINGEIWKKICPSNQCQMVEDEYSSYVVTPDPDDTDPSLYVTLYFYVHDNITNKDLTPLQKKFAERYELSFSCNVNSVKDIIEQGNNIIYKCSGDYTSLRKYNQEDNDPTYYYSVEGTYDTESDTLIGTGEYDRQFPR